MRGRERIAAITTSTPRLKQQLPEVPIDVIALMRTLRAANQAMSTYLDSLFRPLGASESLMHTLLVLFTAEGGCATPRLLCDLVGQTPANMTRILVALEELKYISREVDAGDGRRQRIGITAQGRSFMRTVLPRLSVPIKRVTSEFARADLSQLVVMLRQIAVAFDDGERELRAAGTVEVQRAPRKKRQG